MKKQLLLDKWNDFIAAWADAVRAYNTPITLVQGSEARKTEIEFNGKSHPFVYMSAPGYARRGELMEKQEKEAEKRKEQNLPPRWENDGALCFLCDNVGQAIAAQSNAEIPNNGMYDLEDYFILPNKYPAFLGHSLFVPKKHDNENKRVIPVNGNYVIEEGKTRGAIITPDYLEALVETCDKLSIVGISNHVLDGMSIPGHKHFHLYPEDLRLFSLIDYVADVKKQTDFGEDIYKSENSPFDTLIIKKRDKEKFIEKSCSILEKMEKDNQVFTIFYTGDLNGTVIISPRKNSHEITENLGCGGGLTVHLIDKINGKYINNIKKYVPMKGEYDWGKYMQA